MLFQLPSFILFFIVTVITTRLIKNAWIKPFLLLVSILFYSFWHVSYVVILVYYILLGVIACRSLVTHTKLVWLYILLSLIPLCFFKYTNFFLQSIGIETRIHVGLPLGISFITFTLISMIVDFSRSKKKPFSVMDISLYISFFPHLIAGPILRSREFIPQLNKIKVCFSNIIYNLPLFAVGMIKKVLIADQLASFVDPVFLHPENYGFYDLAIAAIGFSVQIYCDFSAYSDMAIATAGMLGVRFPENFRSPYLAFSLQEIWRRWHMTLSFWLRDYVFTSLFRYCRHYLYYLPILITMMVSGLWHGANWNFVLWGSLHGIIMMIESYTGYSRWLATKRYLKIPFIALNFLVWTGLLILFRCQSIDVAQGYYLSLLSMTITSLTQQNLLILGLAILPLLFHAVDQVDRIREFFNKWPMALLLPIAICIIVGCSMVAAQRPESFYYFDF